MLTEGGAGSPSGGEDAEQPASTIAIATRATLRIRLAGTRGIDTTTIETRQAIRCRMGLLPSGHGCSAPGQSATCPCYNGHMNNVALLADELGVSGRTLRRAVSQGTLRGSRLTPRALDLPLAERVYVRRAWPLLSALRGALRTEQNVRFALLFGSAALGTDSAESDIDLLVDLRDASLDRVVDLSLKLTAVIGRPVDIVRMEDVEDDASFLVDVVSDGRVLVDREGLLSSLSRIASTLRRRARAEQAGRTEGRFRRHRPAACRTELTADEARTADRKRWRRDALRHLEDFPRQYAALEMAMAAFGSDFDVQRFKEAYDTREDLVAYNRVQALERAVGRVQNYVADLAIAGVRLAGLARSRSGDEGSAAQQAFESLRDADVIDGGLCRRLTRAQRARSMIEHSYLHTPAGDVHRAAELVHDAARDFIRPYRTWRGAGLVDAHPNSS